MADNTELITQLTSIVNGATNSVTIDGVTTRWDLEHAWKRLNELKLGDDASRAAGLVRPPVSRINIGGTW